jgi:hypothetical protein
MSADHRSAYAVLNRGLEVAMNLTYTGGLP